MKGGIRRLKVSQVSLFFIGLVCVTVLALTWKKTTLLASFGPDAQRNVLELDSIDNLGSIIERAVSQEVTQRKSKSIHEDIVLGSSVETEHTGKLNAATDMKETLPSVVVKTGLQENRGGKSKSKQVEIEPEKSIQPEEARNISTITEEKDCNYAKGKWVFDNSLPLYSGFGCKQWLSPMWACRLTQRTDFEYEKLRWKPKDCKMEDFTSLKFLQRMQDKTLAFVGDSLGRQQFQSLMCMATGGEERPDVLDVGHEYGLVKARGAIRPDGWAYRFPSTNTTILYYWSASLCDLQPINSSDPNSETAMHLDRAPSFLTRFIHLFDVLVLNTGHHWNRGKLNANKWIMHVGGAPKVMDIAGAKNITVHSIVRWVDSQLPLYPGLKAFLRSISPRHFSNGDWNTGGTCDNTTPLSGGKEVWKNESSDPVAAGAVSGTRVRLLDITAVSELRDEGHISRYSIRPTPGMQDCLHWCLPGIPDAWNEILFAQM